jgi:RNA-directed DNA polymerase
MGTPQGGVISPLLANVYLNALDWAWQERHGKLGTLVRYADDLVICCATKARAEAALEALRALLAGLQLALAEEKTRIAFVSKQGRDGFDFLGFRHRMAPSLSKPGNWYLARWPSDRAMKAAKQRIKELTTRKRLAYPIEHAVRDLNRFLHGWGNYFRHGHSTAHFREIDSYAIDRVGRLLGGKLKKRRPLLHGRAELFRMGGLGLRPLAGSVGKGRVHAPR